MTESEKNAIEYFCKQINAADEVGKEFLDTVDISYAEKLLIIIRQLRTENEKLDKVNSDLLKIADIRKEANFSLLTENTLLKKKLTTAKTEAIKEFLARLKNKKIVVVQPISELPCTINNETKFAVLETEIDDTYKEMVGDA